MAPAHAARNRSVLIAPAGAVATSHPLAADIGLDVLKSGGNAADAAVAASAAMGLMEPMSCGIGGDLFALVWDANSGTLHGLNASGRSAAGATVDHFTGLGLTEIPERGPLSISVPGCVDGWGELLTRFGTMHLPRLLAPAIQYANNGFPVPQVIAGYWNSARAGLSEHAETSSTFLTDGVPPQAGSLFRNPRLAETYRRIALEGRDGFYGGALASDLAHHLQAQGALITADDLAAHTSNWVDPISAEYRGCSVWQIPPPGQGLAVLQMLNILRGHNLAEMGFHSADYWHLMIEAKKLAYADRARYYADPAFAEVPTELLANPGYGQKRAATIDMERAAESVQPGDALLGRADTIYMCVVDKQRNCVSLIQSNYMGFGSFVTPGDLGFAMQNRGCLFSLNPAHANCLMPRKRPFHTIIPGMAMRNGKPWLVFGVMGGDMQPQGQVQVLCNMLDFNMNVQQAGEAPRMEHIYSPTPTGRPGRGSGEVLPEPGFPQSLLDDLRRRGHTVSSAQCNGGGYQAIELDWSQGVLRGASEVRKDGQAVGY